MKVAVILIFLMTLTSVSFSQFNYPLRIGDYWEFGLYNKSYVANDTIMSNGHTYSVIRNYNTNILRRLERQEEMKVYWYDFYLHDENLMFDFTKNIGDTITVYFDGADTVNILCIGHSIQNVFGKNLDQYIFMWDRIQYVDEEEGYYVTDSIGITAIERLAWGWKDTLTGAIINGVRYGNPSVGVTENILTTNYSLSQNYPNPFNSSTNIFFTLPKETFVKLKVYDMLGKEISTLLNDRLQAGRHNTYWNAGKYPSGVYYYRLAAGNYIETKKMILMR